MGFWNRRPKEETPPPAPPQLRPAERHPFALIDGYVPLHEPAFDLYRAIREAVPVVDAAIRKLVRLAGGVGVTCPDKGVEAALNHFLRTVPAGWNQQGIQAFLDSYLDCLLTCGRAVGEIVPSRDGREIAAVLCGRVSDIQVREGDSPLEVVLAQKRPDGSVEDLPRQELLLFTPYHPSPENPYGVSLLRSMPFLAGVLLKIYQTLGANWERAGNVRFAVVYKPDGEADPRQVKEIRELIRQLGKEHTVIFSSHLLPEIQQLCDRVVILHKGKLIREAAMAELTGGDGETIRLRATVAMKERLLLPALNSLECVRRVKVLPTPDADYTELEMECLRETGRGRAQAQLFRLLAGLDAPLMQLTVVKDTLEEVFLRATTEE